MSVRVRWFFFLDGVSTIATHESRIQFAFSQHDLPTSISKYCCWIDVVFTSSISVDLWIVRGKRGLFFLQWFSWLYFLCVSVCVSFFPQQARVSHLFLNRKSQLKRLPLLFGKSLHVQRSVGLDRDIREWIPKKQTKRKHNSKLGLFRSLSLPNSLVNKTHLFNLGFQIRWCVSFLGTILPALVSQWHQSTRVWRKMFGCVLRMGVSITHVDTVPFGSACSRDTDTASDLLCIGLIIDGKLIRFHRSPWFVSVRQVLSWSRCGRGAAGGSQSSQAIPDSNRNLDGILTKMSYCVNVFQIRTKNGIDWTFIISGCVVLFINRHSGGLAFWCIQNRLIQKTHVPRVAGCRNTAHRCKFIDVTSL